MNKKVLKTMIILVAVFLVALYVVKIFFPEQFVMAVSNQNIINIGEFIDNHIALYFIVGIVLGCVFDYLYFSAVCRTFKLKLPLLIIILAYNIIYNSLYTFLPVDIKVKYSAMFVVASICYMLAIPILFTKELKPLAVTYSINYIAQTLSLEIRSLGVLLTTANFLTMFLMTTETYLWLVLCAFLFNKKKEV